MEGWRSFELPPAVPALPFIFFMCPFPLSLPVGPHETEAPFLPLEPGLPTATDAQPQPRQRVGDGVSAHHDVAMGKPWENHGKMVVSWGLMMVFDGMVI